MINMSGATYAYPVPEKKMDRYTLGNIVDNDLREVDWRLENIGYHPYRWKQPNGYSDISTDWLSTELVIRRLMYAKEAFIHIKLQTSLILKYMKKLYEQILTIQIRYSR